jgi:hypothetical protein
MTIATGNDFVAALGEFQLLEPEQLYKVQRAQQSQPADARTIAAHLLKQGWLTPYQAEMLLAGRGAELVAPRPVEPEPLPPPPVPRTVLVMRPPREPIPPRPRRRALWLALAGGFVLVAGLAVATVWYLTKGSDGGRTNADKDNGGTGKDQAKDPEVFIDADFPTALQKGLNVPEGWEGDALRVVKANEEPCLEVSKQDGVAFATLPPVKLSGDFFIMGAYSLPPSHELTIRLEKRENNSLLKIAIQPNGFVRIGDNIYSAPPNYKPYQLSKFLLTRKGRQLNVAINNEVVAAKDLGGITEYETLKLGLTGGSRNHARLYRLKVGTPGTDGSIPNMPLPEPPDKK